MFQGGARHECVVVGATRYAKFGQSTEYVTGCLCTEVAGLGEVAAEKPEDSARCATNRWWKAGEN